jgi:hypothetical protein
MARAQQANGRKRVGIEVSDRAFADLENITARTDGSATSAIVAALRCFRACLDAGLVAESGELFHAHPVQIPHRNGNPGSA